MPYILDSKPPKNVGAEPAVSDFREDDAYRRLAAAAIWRAIEDAQGEDGQLAYSAIRWLSGETTGGLTLDSCCRLLGIAPDRIRSSLDRHFEPIRIRMAQYRKVRSLSKSTYYRRSA